MLQTTEMLLFSKCSEDIAAENLAMDNSRFEVLASCHAAVTISADADSGDSALAPIQAPIRDLRLGLIGDSQ
jgi:hypothetical protein